MQQKTFNLEELIEIIEHVEDRNALVIARHEHCYKEAVRVAKQEAIDGGYEYDHHAFRVSYGLGEINIYEHHNSWEGSLDEGDYALFVDVWDYEPEIPYDDAKKLLRIFPDKSGKRMMDGYEAEFAVRITWPSNEQVQSPCGTAKALPTTDNPYVITREVLRRWRRDIARRDELDHRRGVYNGNMAYRIRRSNCELKGEHFDEHAESVRIEQIQHETHDWDEEWLLTLRKWDKEDADRLLFSDYLAGVHRTDLELLMAIFPEDAEAMVHEDHTHEYRNGVLTALGRRRPALEWMGEKYIVITEVATDDFKA